jgi:hypothetical protein
MQQTRRELVDDLLDFVGEIDDPSARETANRLINRVLLAIWLKHPWRQFWMPTPYQFTVVAGQRAYPLPDYFGRLGSQRGRIRNVTDGAELFPLTPEQLEELDPAAGTSLEAQGEPSYFTIGGTVGVDVQPTSAEAVEVVSSVGADTDIVVSIEGVNASGVWTHTQVTLTGVAAVACGQWRKIVTFSKSYISTADPVTDLTSSRGYVRLSGATSGTLQVLMPYQSAVEHQEIVLYPTPSAGGDTIAVPTVRQVRRLIYDGDVVPQNWGPAVFEAMFQEWRVMNGETGDPNNADRPAFRDLVAYDNTGRLTVPERKRGWRG